MIFKRFRIAGVFCGVCLLGDTLLFFQDDALIRAQCDSRFRVVAQQLFRTSPALRQGDGRFVLRQVAQNQQLLSVRRTIAVVGQQIGIFREEKFDLSLADDLVGLTQMHQRFVEAAYRVRAAEALGTAPEHTLVLEDSYNGVRAGAAGGFVTVMVPDLAQPDNEMRRLYTAECASLHDVRRMLEAGKL